MAKSKMPYITATAKVCDDCRYHHVYGDCCGYALETGRSRMFSMGKQRIPTGKCDKYESKSMGRRRKNPDEVFGTTV